MGNVIGIICEYNPFHKGHKYLIDKAKEIFPDSYIIGIMSGNVMQRGEFALFDKYIRAKTAVINDLDLVVENPFPYCGSTAEIFARSAVYIANSLGVNHLFFGSESGDTDSIVSAAKKMISDETEEKIKKELQNKKISYITARENVLKDDLINLKNQPNNILATEYVKAILTNDYKIQPHCIKRKGSDYNDIKINSYMSASGIRNHFYENAELISIPDNTKKIYYQEINDGNFINEKEIKDFLFRYILLAEPKNIEGTFDTPSGIGYLLKKKAMSSTDSDGFFNSLSEKNITASRMRRIILYYLFNIQEINRFPEYTNLLACNRRGKDLLYNNKNSSIKVITKDSDIVGCDESTEQEFRTGRKVDEFYYSFFQNKTSPDTAHKKKPYIEQ